MSHNRWTAFPAVSLLLSVACVSPATAADLVVSGGVQTLSGEQSFDNVSIINGGKLYVAPYNGSTGGYLKLKANKVVVDATSSIIADGRGYRGAFNSPGEGPGAGGIGSIDGGGGGAYGGKGGNGVTDGGWRVDGLGGLPYGSADTLSIEMGSSAGAAGYVDYSYNDGGFGGNGGGALWIEAENISNAGTISANGDDGKIYYNDSTGGGAGGGILLYGNTIVNTGSLKANGGGGGAYGCGTPGMCGQDDGGGGGGGGRIKIFYGSLQNSGTVSVAGGRGGLYAAAGSNGTFFSIAKAAPPIANAGADISFNEGTVVVLDGSASSSVSGDALSYTWSQIAGTPVALNMADTVHPNFVAPLVSAGGSTLTFQLIVKDTHFPSAPDTVNVTIKNINHPPEAIAGDDQTVAEKSPVQLDGSVSWDLDGEDLTYTWEQVAGPAVPMAETNAVSPTFLAPSVGVEGARLTFMLSVTDGIDTDTDTVDIVVENVNHAPVANAGTDLTYNEGSLVTLNGTSSSDPDLDALSYTWSQVGGPAVILSDATSPNPTFTAPLVGMGGEDLTFQLVVNDGLAASELADEVVVHILNVNDPPSCVNAQVVPGALWPPNHKLVPVTITGVSDPDNDKITLTITGITQDETINGLGDGDTSPDAVIQGDKALLRAERSGTGNGRVYRINFNAADGQGGACTGSVTVGVPHSKNDAIVDDGQNYNALQP
ncbi:PKD domain-containing protein [Geomonas propionica]|uniref:Tandem-95 repeat protein n=1 Tax=Geomonas propionica TaxID=2798582 RepID=A0ABS0YQM1_9BACT|nr:Ig-like domain-containing protein [Geomonas propionica]MBJ6800279.1 hypothetical protein [Geomonas propionica]